MKKILDSKFLFIIALSLIVLIALGFGAFYLFDNSEDTFVKNGYVMNPLSAKSEKFFFSEDTSYRENLSQMVEFKDVDNNDVTILRDSFLHYMDGSLSFLKNGAILDLDSIGTGEAVNFYNITNKSIIEKNGGSYVIKNSGDPINLKNFIGRINDDKYIVVGSLEAKIPGNSKNIQADYFEIVYTEEGVINIENKDVKYQVTAEGTLIYVGNMVIDLGNKKITKNGEDIMSITAITINGNENIEIIPKTKEEDDTEDGNGDNGENGDGSEGGAIGSGDGNGGTGQTNIDSQKLEDIVVSLKNASIGSTSVAVTFDIYNQKDDDAFTLKVTNLDSGRTIDMVTDVKADEDIYVNLLSPNTKYLFTVVNERDGGKYFQKIFETTDFGIKLERTYATDSEIGYRITVGSGTDITNAKLSLYKYNEETRQNEIVTSSYYDTESGETKYIEKVTNLSSLGDNIEGVHEIVYDGLDSNTIYTAVLDEFSLVSSNFKDVYNITLTSMTLKKTPTFNNMTVSKDVGSGTFKLSLENITDLDNAITNYTYLIYENNNPDTPVIEPISKSNASPIEVKIGDKENQLKNDTNYFYKVVIEYYDNEKYIEYITTDSINFVMGSEPYITVVPNNAIISYDKIGATIYLTDNSCLISMPGREKCTGDSSTVVDVSKINSVTGEKTSVYTKVVDFTVSENEIKYELVVDKLQAGTTYSIEVRANRNDSKEDERIAILHTDESKKNITTKSLSSFVTDWVDKGSNANHVVNLQSKFIAEEGSGTLSPEDSANSIKKVTIKLYEGNYVEDIQSRQAIATRSFINTDDFNIKDNFYDNSYLITTDETFGLDMEALKKLSDNGKLKEYYTILISAYYDEDSINEVRLTNNITAYKISPILLMENIEDPKVFLEYITKKASGLDSNLTNDGTIVGYKVTAAFDRAGLISNNLIPENINMYVYDGNKNRVKFYIMNDNGKLQLVDMIKSTLGENNFFETKIYMDYGSEYGITDTVMSRGNTYYIGYDITVNGSGEELLYPTNRETDRPNDYGVYEKVKTEKESPLIKMYIAKSTADSITYRYDIKDADNAIYGEDDSYAFYCELNGEEIKLSLNKKDAPYNMFSGDMIINGLHNGDIYSLYYKKNTTKTGVFSDDVLNYFDGEDDGKRIFDGYYDAKLPQYNLKYQVINNPLVDNKVTIKILTDASFLNRILSYKVKFTDSKGNTLDKELWQLTACDNQDESEANRCFSVDYTELKNAGMKSENNSENVITVSIDAVYDNGLTGYDYTVGANKDYQYMIMQNNITPAVDSGKYVVFSSRGQLANWTESLGAPKGYYVYSMMSNKISYSSELNRNYSANVSFNISSTGYLSNFGVLNPKMVSIDKMESDQKTFSFSSITPKVSINKTTRLINGAAVNLSLSGADIEDFCDESNNDKCINTQAGDKYLYIETWGSADYVGDLNMTVRPTLKVKINNKNTSQELSAIIDQLNNAITYYYNVYAYLNKNDKKVYTQLFDVSYTDRYETKTYTFSSLTSDDIFHNFEVSYKPSNDGKYGDRSLSTRINLLAYENNVSFNFRIGYAFCNVGDDYCGVRDNESNIFKSFIPNEKISTSFVDTVDITKYDLEYNKDYYMYIFVLFDYYEPSSKEVTEKVLQLNRRSIRVNLKKLETPDFIVSREASMVDGDYVIDFNINVRDTDQTLINGEYFVKLTDNNGKIVGNLQVKDDDNNYVTVATNGEYQDYAFDATVANKKIRINNLDPDTKYTITVYSQAYLNNYDENTTKSERTIPISKSHTVYSVNQSGVAFGRDLIFSATEKSIVVTFLGGSNFGNVREVIYTIGLWDNEQSTSTFSGSYEIGKDNKKFETFKDSGDWRFVIDPDGMNNVLGQTYTVALAFYVENPETGNLDYFDSQINPSFAGRTQYVKDNKN